MIDIKRCNTCNKKLLDNRLANCPSCRKAIRYGTLKPDKRKALEIPCHNSINVACKYCNKGFQARHRNRQVCDECKRENQRQATSVIRSKNPQMARARRLVHGRKGKPCSMNVNEIYSLLIKPCYYCRGESTGLDRLDSNSFYDIDNVVQSCRACNTAKGTLTLDQFYQKIRDIYNNIPCV